jgi:1,2-diacylglycerol 3-beta-galactosyltransferase
MPRIVVTTNNSGAGHRATAQAIKDVIARQRQPWHVDMLDLDGAIESTDLLWRVAGLHFSDVNNALLRSGWTMGTRLYVAVMHRAIAMMHPALVDAFSKRWHELQPDLVLSVTPHLNRAMFESLRAVRPHAHFVVMPSDMADCPPHFWFERLDHAVICGTERLYEQARAIVPRPDNVWRVSGMALRPNFYDPIQAERSAERQAIGLRPDLPTGLLSFGGFASPRVVEIVSQIAASGLPVQLIVICGQNRRLAERLRGRHLQLPLHVLEYTPDVARFMWLSDFFIGKPGPGSIAEALVMRLPMIIFQDYRTMNHERPNARWAEDNGVATVVSRVRDIPAAVGDLIAPARYEELRRRIDALPENRAIFEVPDVLKRILQAERPARLAAAS